MLGKLIKYEFRATSRYFVPLYIAAAVMTIIEKLFLTFEQSNFIQSSENVMAKVFTLLFSLLSVLYVFVMIALVASSLVIAVVRFYKNMYTDEGYLTNTLPVSPYAHVGAKLLTSVIWTVLSVVIAFACVMVFFFRVELFSEIFEVLKESFVMMKNTYTISVLGLILKIVPVVLILLMSQILIYYFAVSFGQVLVPKHKVVGSVLAYFIVNAVMQVLAMIGMLITYKVMPDDVIAMTEDFANVMQVLNVLLVMLGSLNGVVMIATYFGTGTILKKRLNLQ